MLINTVYVILKIYSETVTKYKLRKKFINLSKIPDCFGDM